jgi:AcrR family transcriptional regulator
MRDRLVEAAANLIFQQGANDTTLDQVRDAVGASKSQIYHYFSDKDALVRAVIDLQAQRILSQQQLALNQITSLADFDRWIESVIEFGATYGPIGGCPLGSLANELAQNNDEQVAALITHLETWRTAIERGLHQLAVHDARLRKINPEEFSRTLLTAIQGGLMFAKLTQNADTLARSLRHCVALLRVTAGLSR